MKNYKYPSLTEFISTANLIPNQKLPLIIDGNLSSDCFLFQDFDSHHNLLFLSVVEDSDCIAISLNKINVLQLTDGKIWRKNLLSN